MRETVSTSKYVSILSGDKGTVVLLHGFLASRKYWKKIALLLEKEGYRVVMIDLLGFGSAPKPRDIEYTYEDHLRHIRRTLDSIGIQEPVMVVGHSMGALLATRYASYYPDRVSAVGLLNPPIYLDPDQAYQTLRNTSVFYRLLLESRYRHLLWLSLRKMGPFSSHSQKSREGSLENVIINASLADDVGSLQVSGFLLVGRNDRKVYLKNLQSMKIRDNLQVYVEQSGHHAPITHTKSVAHRILSFL